MGKNIFHGHVEVRQTGMNSSHGKCAADNNKRRWFAVRVKSNCERVVATALDAKGFEVCLPVYKPGGSRARSVKKNREVALFPGYIFCRFDAAFLMPVLMVSGVVNVVSRGRIPDEVDPDEMEAIQCLAASGVMSMPCPYLRAGQRVRVREGPLEGVEGILIRECGQERLVISVSLLLRSVMAEVDRNCVEPLPQAMVAA